jgi:VanZ family protein
LSLGRFWTRLIPPPLALAIAWTALILIACLTPRELLPDEDRTGLALGLAHPDKLVHFSLFAVFAVLWCRVRQPRIRPVYVLVAGVLLAGLTELAQELPFIHRDGDIWDALADSLGAVAGTVVWVVRKSAVGLESRSVH